MSVGEAEGTPRRPDAKHAADGCPKLFHGEGPRRIIVDDDRERDPREAGATGVGEAFRHLRAIAAAGERLRQAGA